MTTTVSFWQAIQDRVLVFDGAMGTEIYKRNVLTNRCFDELCLTDPEIVREIHTAYCDAGADVLTTNTFGANRRALGEFGLADRMRAINEAGVRLAREVAAQAGRPVFVAGSIGPVARSHSAGSALSKEALVSILQEQVECLITAGVDLIIFETLPTRAAADAAASAMIPYPDTPFVISYAVFEDQESASGEPLTSLFSSFPESIPVPTAWGMNCASGPDGLLSAVERVLRIVDRPLVVQPNAGIPKEVGGRQIYFCSPDYLAGFAKRYLDLGVRAIGGCCGTSPMHIQEIVQRLKPLAKGPKKVVHLEVAEGVKAVPETPFSQKSRVAWRLANRKWTTTVEMLPPRGYDLNDLIAKTQILYRHGVDAVNLPDGPRASSRISPIVTALHIQRFAQIEVILHFCCRDRNLIGMQADLLACAACEIRNILFVTGDPPKLGNYPFASGVFDMDAIGLCGVQKRLNQGIDLGGQAMNPPTHAVIGVGADPTALDLEREVRRFREKVEAGAEFAITQPVFDPDALLRFCERVPDCRIPILAGIWPLASYRNALFLKNEVPGVIVPDEIMTRMEKAASGSGDTKDAQRNVGIEMAREAVDRLRLHDPHHEYIAGIQVSPPFGNVQTALAVIKE